MTSTLPDTSSDRSLTDLISQIRREVERFQPQAKRIAPLITQLIAALNMTVAELASELGLAPQTIHRWRNGKTVPRPRQIRDLAAWVQSQNGVQNQNRSEVTLPPYPVAKPQNLNFLGIRFANEILALEREAAEVWILKSGRLRESVRGTMGQSVLQSLQNGTHFNYIFLEGTSAAKSFDQLAHWLTHSEEKFTGQIRSYQIADPHLTRALGLTYAPGAWIGIEYSKNQAKFLGRQFDVFFAVATREYADVERTQPKDEDGQAIWIELATLQAGYWLEELKKTLTKLDNGHWQGVQIKTQASIE